MKLIAGAIPVLLLIVGVVSIYVWLTADAGRAYEVRLPGRDGRPAPGARVDEPIKITGQLARFGGVPADLPGSWPRFRGADFDAISKENIELAATWPEKGPRVLWSVDLGEGYAGAAVLAGRVYVFDYDGENKADSIRCLSLADGKDIWRYSYPLVVKGPHGGSRTIPAVTDQYLVAIGPKGHVTCLDTATGEFRWMYNLVREFNTKIPRWDAGQCPLIEDGKAIIAPAGDVLMMAVDCNSGEIVWNTPNPDGWAMTHSSIVPMTFAGKRFYIYCGGNQLKGGVVGVSAENGAVLWKTEEWKVRFNVPTPVVVGEDRVFLTAGYSQGERGCTMLRLTEADGNIDVRTEFLYGTEVFGSIQQTPIYYRNHIYGIRPDGQFVCLDLEGNVAWTSTSANRFGTFGGPYVIAGGMIYAMDDRGKLTLIEANPLRYVQLAQAQVIAKAHESWGPMAVVSGRMIVRDVNRMVCLDISKQ